jgi:hypothetical protein
MYDEDEDDEDEQQAKKDSVVETKKENKRKEKGLKALLNDNASNTKKNNAYKNKKPYYSNNNNQSNQYKNNEYEPKKFYNSRGNYINNNKKLDNDSDQKGRYNYEYHKNNNDRERHYNRDNKNNEPKPHFINSSNKEINNDVRIKNEEGDSKHAYNYNYDKNKFHTTRGKNRDGDEFGPKKFYGKIRTENTERENRPKKNYEDINKEKNENEAGEFSKPRFVNSHLDNDVNENIKELETKGDLFLEKFKKFDDSSKAIEKVDSRDEGENHKHGDNNYYKKDSGKRK